MCISLRMTEKKRQDLKQIKPPGPEGIHPKFLKECASVLARTLFIVFRKSVIEKKLPDEWKSAQIYHIHKTGSRVCPENYRPVVLTCVESKSLESIIKDMLMEYFESNELLTMYQHGFRKGKSCLTNLLVTLENWTEALDEGHCVDTIFLDFQKASDTVPHQRLILKLKAFGVRGQLAN